MKMAKRILICLLAVSLMVGVFAAAVYANGEDGPVTEPKLNAQTFDDIMTYYDNEVYYLQNFNGIAASDTTKYTENMLIGSNQNIYVRDDGTGNNYLAMSAYGKNGRIAVSNNFFFYYDSGKNADAVIELDVGAEQAYVNYGIYLADKKPEDDGTTKAFDVVANKFDPIVKFNFDGTNATVLYYTEIEVEDEYGAPSTEIVYAELGTVPCDASGWIPVTVIYDSETKTCSVKIAEFDEFQIADVDSAACVLVGAVKDGNDRTSYVKLDNFKFYEGGEVRDVDADRQALTEEWIVDLLEYYNYETDIEIKLEIIGMVDELKEKYAFTTENAEASAALEQLRLNSILVYAEALEDCCDIAAEMVDYTEKLALVNEYSQYANKIPDDYEESLDAVNAERVSASVASYNALIDELSAIEEKALAFIDAMSKINAESDDYAELRENCIAMEPYADGVDATYPGAGAELERFCAMRDRRDARAIAGYVDNVTSAHVAVYLPAKENYLRIAKENYLIVIEAKLENHEKIVAAKILHAKIAEANENRAIAAQDYIDSCDAIAVALEGNDMIALQAAVSVSEGKKAALGDIRDIESLDGMSEANILLSNAQTALKITSLRCQQFVAYVAMIDNDASIQERYAAINKAIAVESGTDETYENVTEAMAALRAAIDAYNAEVNALNAAFSETVEVAADVSSAVSTEETENVIASVVAVIKSAGEVAVLPDEE